MPLLVEKSLFRRLKRVKIALLTGDCLLVLEHFLVGAPHHSESMDVDLSLILKVLESSQDLHTVAELDVFGVEHKFELLLSICRIARAGTCEIVEPEHASDDSSGVVDTEEVLLFFLYVEDHCARD